MGGTIDKDYFDALSEYQVVDSILVEEISRLGVPLEMDTTSVCKKDSLEVTDEDRAALKQAIENTSAPFVLVSHGTDTMAQTAEYLGEIAGKTVGLFGAMRPLRFKDTDAIFNAAFALGALVSQPPGVYLAMSGQVFKAGEVVKNRAAGRFEKKR